MAFVRRTRNVNANATKQRTRNGLIASTASTKVWKKTGLLQTCANMIAGNVAMEAV